MKYAVYAPTFNDYGEPARLVELALAAEGAGWDGFFIWDHLVLESGGRLAVVDATVVLGALAHATSRLTLGAMITPLARRRPWKVAKELATLDHLSGGRMVFGAGLGEPAELEFAAFGEDPAATTRAARLDEGLTVFDALVRGERLSFTGTHYRLADAQLAPPALQRPRMPVWIAASLPARAGVRRAARWDGVVPVQIPARIRAGEVQASAGWPDWWPEPATFAEAVRQVAAARGGVTDGFDFVASGRVAGLPPAAARARVAAFAEAGATWWLDWVDEAPGTFDATMKAIADGPPCQRS